MLLSALFILPSAAAVAFCCYLPYAAMLWVQKRRLPLMRHATLYLLVSTFVMLSYATIFWYGFPLDFHPAYRFLNLRPFAWAITPYAMGTSRMVAQLLLNVAMFVPVGLLLPLASRHLNRFWRTAAACLGITLAIETLQYFIGRSADIDDVLLNLLGGMLGYGLFALARRRYGRQRWFLQCAGEAETHNGAPGVQGSTANANCTSLVTGTAWDEDVSSCTGLVSAVSAAGRSGQKENVTR